MDNTIEELIEATLEWCNEKRKEQGKRRLSKLPKGERGDPHSCPCGKATGLYVGTDSYYESEDRPSRRLPPSVKVFVEYFDDGYIPELDLNPIVLQEE